MKLVRTWPAEVPPGRAHVVDSIPRYVMGDYDYRGLLDDAADDVLILEWDIAASAEHLDAFIDVIRSAPGEVHAAPYRIYRLKRDPGPHWVMRRYAEGDELRWATEDDKSCHLFGFGMTYIPRQVWQAYRAEHPTGFVNDNVFSRWHHASVRAEVPIPWDIRPVHLHYPLKRP